MTKTLVTTKAPETDLPDRLRVYLQGVAATGGPVTYAEAARALGLEGPQKIHRVAMALEQLMAEDAAAGRPFVAALVISKARNGSPAPGFFDMARRLGRLPAEAGGMEATAFHRAEVEAAQAHHCRAANPAPPANSFERFIGPAPDATAPAGHRHTHSRRDPAQE